MLDNALEEGVEHSASKAGELIEAVVEQCLRNSFSADTLVTTAEGLRPISTIAVGNLVLAWDETTRATGYYTVTAVMLHTDAAQVHLSVGGEHVETTPEHPFFTRERGWVAAGDLWDGAHVRRADGSYALTLVLWLDAEPQVMYNLTVATAHTFFVGVERVLVHNAKCKITEVFYQKIGGSSDGWSKGFHLNTNDRKIEIMLKPEEVNGVIRISLIARGENARDARITSAVVNSVRNLLREDPDGGRALANSIITQYQHDDRRGAILSVNDARLMLRALNGETYEVVESSR